MHTTSGRWRLGLALALTTAVCWGLLPIALTVTLAGMDAWTLTWYRFATSAVALGLFLAWRGRLPLKAPLTRRGWWLYAIALLGLVANYVSYLVSLDLTSPTIAQVLIQLAPVLLLFGGLLVFRERFAPLQWFGFAVLVTGLAVFFHDRIAEVFALETRLGLGVAIMVFSAVVWACIALAQKQLLTQLASEQVLFLLYVGAVPLLLAPAHLAQILALDGLQFGMLAFCCANTVVAYGCFAEALRALGGVASERGGHARADLHGDRDLRRGVAVAGRGTGGSVVGLEPARRRAGGGRLDDYGARLPASPPAAAASVDAVSSSSPSRPSHLAPCGSVFSTSRAAATNAS